MGGIEPGQARTLREMHQVAACAGTADPRTPSQRWLGRKMPATAYSSGREQVLRHAADLHHGRFLEALEASKSRRPGSRQAWKEWERSDERYRRLRQVRLDRIWRDTETPAKPADVARGRARVLQEQIEDAQADMRCPACRERDDLLPRVSAIVERYANLFPSYLTDDASEHELDDYPSSARNGSSTRDRPSFFIRYGHFPSPGLSRR